MRLKNILLILILSCASATLTAQDKQYFIYLQSDQNQLFYVRENGKILSSSRTGYLIIPQLKEGGQKIVIGFPKNKFPEQLFSVTLDNNHDEGFLLKQNGQDEFALYNLQNYAMLAPKAISKGSSFAYNTVSLPPANNNSQTLANDTAQQDTTKKQVDEFRKMLHAAANESKPVATTVAATDTTQIINNIPTPPDIAQGNVLTASTIDSDNIAGNNILFTDSSLNNNDKNNSAADTSQIIAGNPPEIVTTDTAQQNITLNNIEINAAPSDNRNSDSLKNNLALVQDTISAVNTNDNAANNNAVGKGFPFRKEKNNEQQNNSADITFISGISTGGAQPQANIPAGNNNQPAEENTVSSHEVQMINSDCQSLVSDDKFDKVRRKMASENNEEAMLRIAMRYLKEDCYSVAQLQNLVYLFNTDEYRYRFLDMAYPHTYDTDHFSRLQNVLTSEYYRGRFHSMIKK